MIAPWLFYLSANLLPAPLGDVTFGDGDKISGTILSFGANCVVALFSNIDEVLRVPLSVGEAPNYDSISSTLPRLST